MTTRRGFQALILSRKRSAPLAISTGAIGNAFSDATQESFLVTRGRLYALGPAFAEKWSEFERLYNQWFVFYGSPIHDADPEGMTAPQREIWYREQAQSWAAAVDGWQPRGPSNDSHVGVFVVLGVLTATGIAYGVSR